MLYHITAKKNVDSILSKGLIPNFQRGLSRRQDYAPCVWLTDDTDYILETQAGDLWREENDPVVLEIDADGLDVKQYMCEFADGLRPIKHEYYITSRIDSARIKLKDICLV